jgi:TRAP-type transport system small permease protein
MMARRVAEHIRRVELISALLLLTAIVILVAIASIARKMGSPIIWSVEIAQLLFVWLCIFAADLALQHDRHFGLSVISDLLNAKGKKILETVNRVVLVILLVFLLYYAWINTGLMHPRRVGATQMHGSFIHASMLVGFLLLLRTMVAQLIALWRPVPQSKEIE